VEQPKESFGCVTMGSGDVLFFVWGGSREGREHAKTGFRKKKKKNREWVSREVQTKQ